MIDELKILQEMFGQLTGLGGWAIGAYFVYKLLVMVGWLCVLWFILLSIKWYVEKTNLYSANSDIEVIMLKNKNIRQEDRENELRQEIASVKRECEEVKHMYKILKGAK